MQEQLPRNRVETHHYRYLKQNAPATLLIFVSCIGKVAIIKIV